MTSAPISPLRQRMIEDMTIRGIVTFVGFSHESTCPGTRRLTGFQCFSGLSRDAPRPEIIRICLNVTSPSEALAPPGEGLLSRPRFSPASAEDTPSAPARMH